MTASSSISGSVPYYIMCLILIYGVSGQKGAVGLFYFIFRTCINLVQ